MNTRRFLSALLGLLLGGLWLTGLAVAQEPAEVVVTLGDYSVEMSTTTISAGTPVTFTATNEGNETHEVVLERAGTADEPLEIDGEVAEIEDIEPGQTKSAVWTIAEPGEYQLACHLPGHYEQGMVQRFTVTAAAPAQLPATGGEGYSTRWIVLAMGLLSVATAMLLRRTQG